MLKLDDRGDLGEPVDPLEEWVFDDFAKAARKGEKPLRRERLSEKEDHEVVELGAPDRCDHRAVEILREVGAADFGSERAGNRADLKGIGHQ